MNSLNMPGFLPHRLACVLLGLGFVTPLMAAQAGSEVVGEVPGDLQVFSVQTLDDALSVLDTISSGGDLAQLPTCE